MQVYDVKNGTITTMVGCKLFLGLTIRLVKWPERTYEYPRFGNDDAADPPYKEIQTIFIPLDRC